MISINLYIVEKLFFLEFLKSCTLRNVKFSKALYRSSRILRSCYFVMKLSYVLEKLFYFGEALMF